MFHISIIFIRNVITWFLEILCPIARILKRKRERREREREGEKERDRERKMESHFLYVIFFLLS